MTLHQFRIIVDSVPTDDQIDALFALEEEPGVGGSPREGTGVVEFELRTQSTLAEAVAAGIRIVESVGLHPVRVENEDWVTVGDIGERIGRSRETVRLWSTGKQGPGGFPPPLNGRSDPKTAFYSWAEVAPWLRDRMGMEVRDEEPVLAAANLALQLRALAPRIEHMDEIRNLVPAA